MTELRVFLIYTFICQMKSQIPPIINTTVKEVGPRLLYNKYQSSSNIYRSRGYRVAP